MTVFEMLSQYRLCVDETWPQFAKRFGRKITYPTLFRILAKGHTPNERTAFQINKYFDAHESEIRAAVQTEQPIES